MRASRESDFIAVGFVMRTHPAFGRVAVLLVILGAAGFSARAAVDAPPARPGHAVQSVESQRPAAGAGLAEGQTQGSDQVVRAEGLELTRHPDNTYELSAADVPLEQLVAHLISISGAEFSVAPELLHERVTVETDRVGLDAMLEQLRASLQANLILAATREHRISRVWLTATTAPAATAADPTAAAPSAAAPAGVSPGVAPPQGALPLPTGDEVRAAGYDPSVDMGEYIRGRAAAAETGAGNGSPGQQAGQPAGEGEPAASSEPPIPMDPNALETYFAGDSATKTYHRLNCIQAMYLPAANKIWFKSRQEAIAAGYTPHDVCLSR